MGPIQSQGSYKKEAEGLGSEKGYIMMGTEVLHFEDGEGVTSQRMREMCRSWILS